VPPSPEEIAAALPTPPADALAAAAAETDERAIRYRMGSGEAEEIALAAGLRHLVRQTMPRAQLSHALERLTRRGLLTRVAPAPEGAGEGAPGIVYAGRDRAKLDAAFACEAAEDHAGLGALLGYPRCCVAAFDAAPHDRRSNRDLCASAARATRGAPRPRLNVLDLNVFHYVSWFPCAFDCAPSLAFADAVAVAAASRHAPFLARIDRALAAHRLLLHDDVQVSLRGAWNGRGVAVAASWPTARDRHADARLGAAARDATARLLVLVRRARTVAVVDGALVLDGEPARGVSSALLVPFGGSRGDS
jgi:hypothetical protein